MKATYAHWWGRQARWTLRSDEDGLVIAEGSREYIEAQYPRAVALGLWDGQLYIEDPEGIQWGFTDGQWQRR